MGYKKVNISFVIIISLFVLGILFASSYSANKTQLATLSLTNSQSNSSKLAQKITKIKGVKTVFLDNGTQLLTLRYDNSKLNLKKIKKHLENKGILVEKLNSIKIIPSKERSEIYKKNRNIVELNFSPS